MLLQFFYNHPNRVVSRDALLTSIWVIKYFDTTRTVDQHIPQLRKKIEPDPACPRFLATLHGVGYRYNSLDE
jgi:DNA-binding response OmpR family regulator